MELTSSIKRAPRWAVYTVLGVSAGAIGIKVWKDRAVPASDTTNNGTEVGTPTYGSPGTSSSPTPVITPPVIIGGGDSGDGGALSQFVSTLGDNFDTLVAGITGLSAGDQQLAGQGMSGITEIATAVIAGAGSAPAPLAQNPTPIIVNVPPPQTPSHSIPHNTPKPCCTYNGHPLSWWRNPTNAKNKHGWIWPGGGNSRHSRAFSGNRACDGGGTAGGSKKDC